MKDIVERLRCGTCIGEKPMDGVAIAQGMADAADEILRLRAALTPFAEAWKTVTSNEAVVRTCSLSQLGRLCECELSGADFQQAALSLQPKN